MNPSKLSKNRLLVVGGGAAGYFAACRAKELHPELDVVIAEAEKQPLRKVRISGGGRCNVTQNCFDPATLVRAYPRGEKELRGPFSRFQPKDTIAWFESRGVSLKTEADGRVFPKSDNSQTIIDCLEKTRSSLGIKLWTQAKVQSIQALDSGFKALIKKNDERIPETFTTVVIASGSANQGYQIARSLGHSIEPCVPSLFTFQITDTRIEGLAGISSQDASLLLKIEGEKPFTERGPLLITHWGFSGPAVIRLSAWAARPLAGNSYQGELTVNFLPNLREQEILDLFEEHSRISAKKYVASEPLEAIPKRLWERLVAASEIKPETRFAELSRKQKSFLSEQLSRARFQVSGKGVFKEEFVTCGGVRLSEVDFRSMQSKLIPNLYFAGEILDIDGITGGYNFQSAWTTGWIAGELR